MRDVPAQFALDALDGRGRRRRARRHHPHAARREPAQLFRRIGDADEDGRRRTEHGHRLARDILEDGSRLGFAQADVRAANGGDDPDKGPAVGVEHWQRPEIAVGAGHVQMHERADDIEPGVAMGDHHAFGPRGRAAGVIERKQIALPNFRPREVRRRGRERCFVIQPPGFAAFQRDEVLDVRHLPPDAIHRLEIIRVRAHHARAAVVDDVGEVVGGQAVVDRHDDRADLRHGIEGFELRVRVRRDVGHAIALAHAEPLQRRRPAVTALEELLVGQPQRAIHDRLAVGVELARAAREFQRRQRRFHLGVRDAAGAYTKVFESASEKQSSVAKDSTTRRRAHKIAGL